MTMRIEILSGAGAVINTIASGIDFAEVHFPGAWRVSDEQDMPATAPVQILDAPIQAEEAYLGAV